MTSITALGLKVTVLSCRRGPQTGAVEGEGHLTLLSSTSVSLCLPLEHKEDGHLENGVRHLAWSPSVGLGHREKGRRLQRESGDCRGVW